MPSDVTVNFSVGGIAQVMRAFETLEQAMLRYERGSEKTAARSSRARVSGAEKEAKEKQRILDRSASDQIKAFQKADSEQAKALKSAVRDVEKAEKEKTRIKERETREQMRIWQRADAAEMQAKRAGAREADQIRKREEASAAQWVRKREREQQTAARRDVANRERFSRSIGGAVSRGFGGATNAAIGMAGSVLSLGGGFSVADSVHDRLSLDLAARQLSNSAFIPGTNERQSPAKIMGQVRAASLANGIDASELMTGMQGYVAKSSDFTGGMKNMDFFARLAKGTGTKFEDVTSAAGALKVQNKGLSDKQMQEMLLSVVMQGKQGAVEFSDLAKVAGQMTKTSAAYGMNQTDAQRELLGLGQIAMRTSGSPAEAATVVSNFANDSMKHQKAIGKVAGKITDKKGDLLDPMQILSQVFEKTGGNLGKIQDLGYGARSMKLIEALAPSYREGGVEGLESEVSSLTGAKYGMGILDRDHATIMQSPAEQLEGDVRAFKDAVGSELTPALIEIIPKFRDALPALSSFVREVGNTAAFFAKNPWTGLGALVSGFIIKELAVAAIGSTLEKGMLRILNGIKVPTGGVGGASADGGSKLGNAVAGTLGIGLALGTAASVSEAVGGGADAGQSRLKSWLADIDATEKGAAGGSVSKEDAERKLREYKGALSTAQDKSDTAHGLLSGASMPLALVSGDARKDIGEYHDNKKVAEGAAELEKAFAKLQKRLDAMTPPSLPSGPAAAAPNRGQPMTAADRGGTQ